MTCKVSVIVRFVLPTKVRLVIHRSELDSIGRNAYISCSLDSAIRHDAIHVEAAVTKSPAMFKMGRGNDEGRCHTVWVDELPQSRSRAKLADWLTMNTFTILVRRYPTKH